MLPSGSSIGTRRKPGAAGRDADCPPKRNGKRRQSASPRWMGRGLPRANAGGRGAKRRQRARRPISTLLSARRSTAPRLGRGRVPSAGGTRLGKGGEGG